MIGGDCPRSQGAPDFQACDEMDQRQLMGQKGWRWEAISAEENLGRDSGWKSKEWGGACRGRWGKRQDQELIVKEKLAFNRQKIATGKDW